MSVLRRAGGLLVTGEETRPLYARVLRLRYLNPSGALCFVFLEGSIALGILLALAELISGWGVLLLPACVAAMVKINDAVAGAVVRSAARSPALRPEGPRRPPRSYPVVGRASVPGGPSRDQSGRVYKSGDSPAGGWTLPAQPTSPAAQNGVPADDDLNAGRPWDLVDPPDTPEQRARQAATRRYE